MDFRGEPFGSMGELMAIARSVTKLTAICPVCRGEATMTQRLCNGAPAHYNEPVVVVGAQDRYEPRCFDDWVVLHDEDLPLLLLIKE